MDEVTAYRKKLLQNYDVPVVKQHKTGMIAWEKSIFNRSFEDLTVKEIKAFLMTFSIETSLDNREGK